MNDIFLHSKLALQLHIACNDRKPQPLVPGFNKSLLGYAIMRHFVRSPNKQRFRSVSSYEPAPLKYLSLAGFLAALLKRFCWANVYASSSPASAIDSSASCTRDSVKSFQYCFCSKHHDVHAILNRVTYQNNVAMAIASLS